MTLYRKYIRPMHSFPGSNGSPRVMSIETEAKWYPEEEREQLENKYAAYNKGSFSDLIFEEKLEPYAVAPQFNKKNLKIGLEEVSDFFFEMYRKETDEYKAAKAKEYCDVVEEALNMLKEQETVEPIIMDYKIFGTSRKCSKCNRELFPAGKYCPHCGRSVKWE